MGEDFKYAERSDEFFNQTSSWDVDIEHILDQSGEEQQAWLEDELERIKQQLEKRDDIHEKIVGELEWKLDRYTDRLENLYRQNVGKHDGKRIRLQNRIVEFYEELREEHRSHWRDMQTLEEERREILRELDRTTSDYLSGS